MKTTNWFAKEFITPKAVSSIKDAIEKAGGNEIFLVGKIDNDLLVSDIDVYAMGSRHAVPAILQDIKYGDVIIHNHPNGKLVPSEADLEIASHMGSLGVGFYIIDNQVVYVYPVVKIQERQSYEKLDSWELSALFHAGGYLSKKLSLFEYRTSQIEMLKSVINAFNDDKIAVIEAGTGTGKSLAYLIPALYWGKKNRERVVVSTHTINLQEQLIHKDIPTLKKAFNLDFKSVLVKGRNNYLCLRKTENLRTDGNALVDDASQYQVNDILEWAVKTQDGSKSDLNFIPQDELWELVRSEADQCTRLKCRFYDTCFFYRARRNAASADILIVNHYLFMADLIIRKEAKGYDAVAILPPFKKIILDEAHHLEEVATANLGITVSRLRIIKQLGRLINLKNNSKGLLPYLKKKLKTVILTEDKTVAAGLTERINTEILDARQNLYDTVQKTFEDICVAVSDYTNGKKLTLENGSKLRITQAVRDSDLWTGITEKHLKALCREMNAFISVLNTLLDTIGSLSKKSQESLSSILIDIVSCKTRLKLTANDLSFFLEYEEKHCRWIELKKYKRSTIVRFCSAPISVADDLKLCIYDHYRTIVFTSATLTINRTFHFFRENIGLNLLCAERIIETISDSPFDYKKQSIFGVLTDISEPDKTSYVSELGDNISKLVEISEGRALILFTSYKLLDTVFNSLELRISRLGYTCLKQGMDSRHNLLETFKRDKTSVLFATDSFWEGIDVKGDALECVILTRLPFRVPTEPIIEARAEAIERAGGNAFYDFSLPLAIIKLKQGIGRLIRSKEDRGVVVIFDRRIVTKSYGNLFLKSLPEAHYIKDKRDVVFKEIGKFLGKPSGISGRI